MHSEVLLVIVIAGALLFHALIGGVVGAMWRRSCWSGRWLTAAAHTIAQAARA
jgi:hypothetical protein